MYRSLRSLVVMIVAAALVASASAEKTAPVPLKTPSPAYPSELVEEALVGQVVVQFTIGTDGKASEPVVKSSDHELFSGAVLAVLGEWEFKPATEDGEPVAMKASLPFQFKPPNTEDRLNQLFGRAFFVRFAEEPIPMNELKNRPRPKTRGRPKYPDSKKGSGEERRVRVQFTIGKDGATYNPKLLDEVEREWALPALATIATMTFDPIKHRGKKVLVRAMFPIMITENPRGPGGGQGGRRGGGRGGN